MVTTYWENNFGVMIFRDAISEQNLLCYYVENKTIVMRLE